MSSIIDNIVLLIIRSVWPVSNVTSVHDVENTDRKTVLNADTAGMHLNIARILSLLRDAITEDDDELYSMKLFQVQLGQRFRFVNEKIRYSAFFHIPPTEGVPYK